MTTLVKGEVSNKIADLMSSTTMVVLLKTNLEAMAKLKWIKGEAYLHPQRPLGMGSTLVKVASNCVLSLLKGNMGPTIGQAQFFVEIKGGCNQVQWAIESSGRLSTTCLDDINAFDEIERACIKVALLANPFLHMLIPLLEMLYERRSGELCFYDENGNFIDSYFSRYGFRQGYVFWAPSSSA
jgi:hypothetical protein